MTGSLLLALAAAGVAFPLAWQRRQAETGAQAVRADHARFRAVARRDASAGTTCTPRPGPGVLQIPSLHLTAPVDQGLSDAVLATALGHDPSTAWPGPHASSLVAGHDVGFLSADTSLQPGDRLSYEEPCATLHYTVTGHEVTAPGQQVTLPAGGGLVLDTCWPTDALWYTPQRYLVIARYVSTTPSPATLATSASAPTVPAVTLPAGLTAAQLSLSANPWPMGTLSVEGSPGPAWTASQASLAAEADALELLFGLRHALEAGERPWLEVLASGVDVPAWLDGAPAAALDVVETVSGTRVEQVALRSSVRTRSGTVPFALVAVTGAPGTPAGSAGTSAGGPPNGAGDGWHVTSVTATP